MGTTPEGKVKNWARNKIKKELPDVWLYAAPGGMYGKAGTPDDLGLWNGVMFAIEYKADSKKEPTALQMVQLRHLDRQGCLACVIRGKNAVRLDNLISMIKEKAGGFKA